MRKLGAYLPVVVWMCVIFTASTDIGSRQRTSRFIGPFLHWLFPQISDEAVYNVQSVVRKGGHVSEYALLAALILRARRRTTEARGWVWREFWIVLACCAIYAATDELHQSFVPSRGASFWDVLLDTCGAAAGLLAIYRIGRWRRYW